MAKIDITRTELVWPGKYNEDGTLKEVPPFEKRNATVRTKDMNLHALPWPREELLALGAEQVELRVTLSYFVEPNPARRRSGGTLLLGCLPGWGMVERETEP